MGFYTLVSADFFCVVAVDYLDDVVVGPTLVRVTVLGVLEQDVVHVCTGVLEQFVAAAEHDECNFTVAQHAQFVRFLHQTELALRKRHLQHKRTEQCHGPRRENPASSGKRDAGK